jgi:uncharacterized membrane protein YeaQ/YmgE (transglycosylase-associated protein family)
MYIPWTEVVGFLVLGAICAALAQALAGFSRAGYFAALIAGFFGAWCATWLSEFFDWPGILVITINRESFPLVWAVIGALLMSLAMSLLLQRTLLRTIEEVAD